MRNRTDLTTKLIEKIIESLGERDDITDSEVENLQKQAKQILERERPARPGLQEKMIYALIFPDRGIETARQIPRKDLPRASAWLEAWLKLGSAK